MELPPVTVLSALQSNQLSEPISFLLCRLRQLDKHGQATAQQLVQLLNKQNQLLLDRQNLSEEVDRLRAQVRRGGTQRGQLQPKYQVAQC